MTAEMVLYTYFRSSAAWRVRIALNFKGLKREDVFIHLRRKDQLAPEYRALNPQGLVPTLIHGGHVLTQSLAIVEYLEEVFPAPPLLPKEALARARVRALALAVACDIHPLNNLRVSRYLKHESSAGDEQLATWQRHWISEGFAALEAMLAGSNETGRFCHGAAPTLADICLIPQMFNARQIALDLSPWPTLLRIEEAASAHPAFAAAHPSRQPDAE